MNCPGHFLIYASDVRSYRDLPIRFHEQTPLHRNEASGVLAGLTRVRQFSQDDAHCFVTQEQIGEEVERLIRLVQRVYGDFGLPLHGEAVDAARRVPRRGRDVGSRRGAAQGGARARRQLPTRINEKDGAFYGPKIDFDVTDAHRPQVAVRARSSSITSMPERFDLKYIGADNAEHRPVVIHRAIFGSFERFIAILIEHYAGAFPLWLAPVQAIVLPIADRHADYAAAVRGPPGGGRAAGRARRRGRRRLTIRSAKPSCRRFPICWWSGDREVAEGTVSVRSRSGGDLGARAVDEFIAAGAGRKWRRRASPTRARRGELIR